MGMLPCGHREQDDENKQTAHNDLREKRTDNTRSLEFGSAGVIKIP
jgi:hypothetical protein